MPQAECDAIKKGLLGNPLDFLSKNIVSNFELPIKGIPTSAERLLDFTQDVKTEQGGIRYQTVLVDNPFALNAPLGVSFLPWGANAGYYIILEPKGGPDIMMTAALEGCAIGYLRARDGAVKVSHYNIRGKTDHEGDVLQADALAFMGFESYVNAPHYRYPSGLGLEGMAYVFGVRLGGQWTMYVQRVSHDGRAYSIVDVAAF
jgi:hypothetical protein